MRALAAFVTLLALSWSVPLVLIAHGADVQVNAADHNAPNLANFTTESETSVAVFGSLVVVGYNSSKQAGLLGSGAWTSLSGFAYSSNGGSTFTDGGFVPVGTGRLTGDPSLSFDRAGNLYYASLGTDWLGISSVFVSKSSSTSPNVTFTDPVTAGTAQNGFLSYVDKDMLTVDTTGGSFDGRIYVGWSEFPSSGAHTAQVRFAASSSTSPLAFSPSIPLSPADALYLGAMPAVGPNGEVYVAWGQFTPAQATAPTQSIHLLKSTDGGATFSNPDPSDPAPDKTLAASITPTTRDMVTGGIHVRTRGFPSIAVDRTPPGSPTRGNIYIVFQATPPPPSTARSEIFFTRSTDGGKTWSAPRDVSSGAAATIGADITANDNWLPSVAISPTTGHLSVAFYSRREDPSNTKIRVYEARSTDAGPTWFDAPFSGTAFTPSTGYDDLLNQYVSRDYMGDYLHVFADGSRFLAAWGDARNTCAPPAGAPSPCSPAGRGDQDVFLATQTDSTGIDLFITPWGAVSGTGPLWQSPDIYVVDPSNNVTNAKRGMHNTLRARVRNIGTLAARGAVVRFRYAPIFLGLADAALKQIAAPSVDFAQAGDPSGNDVKVVPADWDLTNLADTNGGLWPMPVSAFDHFCVKVSVEHPDDINLSNNNAQTNFFDVTTESLPLPLRFLVGNPFDRQIRARIVTASLPKGYGVRLAGLSNDNTLTLRPREIRVATLTLVRPLDFEKQRRAQDVVASISMQVGSKTVGGLSLRLARANIQAKPSGVVNRKVLKAQGAPHMLVPTRPRPVPVQATVPRPPQTVIEAVVRMLRERKYRVAQVDPLRGIVSSGAVPLNVGQIRQVVVQEFARNLPADAAARYFVSVQVKSPSPQSSQITVSARVVLENRFADSPIGGWLVPSSGALERQILAAVVQRLRAAR